MQLGWQFAEFLITSLKPSSNIKAFQRLQACELLSALFRISSQNQALATDHMDKLIEPLTSSIVESIGSAETFNKQKVKKTL